MGFRKFTHGAKNDEPPLFWRSIGVSLGSKLRLPNETGFCWGRQYVRGSHLDLVFAGRGYVYYKEEQSKGGISELNGDQTSRTMPTFLPHFINHGELE